jgi:hypothetical protein
VSIEGVDRLHIGIFFDCLFSHEVVVICSLTVSSSPFLLFSLVAFLLKVTSLPFSSRVKVKTSSVM